MMYFTKALAWLAIVKSKVEAANFARDSAASFEYGCNLRSAQPLFTLAAHMAPELSSALISAYVADKTWRQLARELARSLFPVDFPVDSLSPQ